jgi:hypothetical protein
MLTGEWPLRSGSRWDEIMLIALADRLAEVKHVKKTLG